MWQTQSHRIQKFTADGQFIPPAWGKFNAQGNPLDGNGNGEFNTPHGIVKIAATMCMLQITLITAYKNLLQTALF